MKNIEKIKKILAEKNIDAILITSPENHRYSTGFNNPDGTVLITGNKSYCFADFRYIEAAKKEVAKGYEVIMPTQRIFPLVASLLAENGVKSLGFEDATMSFKEYSALKKEVGAVDLVPASELLTDIRVIKSKEEIGCILRAQRIAEDSLEELIKNIKYDMTEIEVAAELEYIMKKKGSEVPSFETIAISGSASSSPHGVPRNVRLERGFLTIDFGAVVKGYRSDMTRTFVIGKADGDMKKLYNTVLQAQLDVLEVITEGANNRKMDNIARTVIYENGYEGCFGHSLGHGVGLEIHENPNLSPNSPVEQTLREGEIVTVEPGIYIEGKYGCRIEDMVAITKGGAINLTVFPKEMVEL